MLLSRRLKLVVPAVLCARAAYCQPTFTANDFVCFINRWQAHDPYCDFDGVGGITANDFITFKNSFAVRELRANCDGSSAGWTDLTPPFGARVAYVSVNGSTTAPCTQAQPCTLATAFATTVSGPNQVLFKCGETYSNVQLPVRFSGSENSYFVYGSWGTGPRPKFLSNDSIFQFGAGKVGVAIVGLHLEYTGSEQNKASMFGQDGTRNFLIEDCYISGWGDGIVFHATANGRLGPIKVRRNVVVDTRDTDGRCQGMFFGEVDGLEIVENVLDWNGRSTGPQTIFMHNVYIHESCGAAIFNGNISTRATSHGVQERPGGQMVNNFFYQNGVNCYVGDSANATQYISYNVVIDGKDISAEHPRGIAYEINGHGAFTCNIAANQVTGTENVTAFGFAGFDSGLVAGNYVYNWRARDLECWPTCAEWNGGSGSVTVENNKFYLPSTGMLNRHETRPWSSQFTYRNNSYFTATPAGGCDGYFQFSTSSGVGVDWNTWRSRDPGSVFLSSAPANPQIGIQDVTGQTPEAWIHGCRGQSRQTWNPLYTAAEINRRIRERTGTQQPN